MPRPKIRPPTHHRCMVDFSETEYQQVQALIAFTPAKNLADLLRTLVNEEYIRVQQQQTAATLEEAIWPTETQVTTTPLKPKVTEMPSPVGASAAESPLPVFS